MKRIFLYLSLGAALIAWSVPCAQADDDNGAKTTTTEKHDTQKGPKGGGNKKTMARAVKACKPINGKISPSAKYILMYHISSVEAICEEPLEKLVAAQKDMKKAKMEVVLISHDRDAELAQKFIKEKKANKFALILADNPVLNPKQDDNTTNTKKKKKKGEDDGEILPGFNPKAGTGSVVILDCTGAELAGGSADLIDRWQDYAEDSKTKKTNDSETNE